MEFTIYRDLPSIAFVRCFSPIPGSKICAEGTGFSVAKAIAKCRSERIEGEFQLAHPQRELILGIAAHPSPIAAEEHACSESLETLLLENIAANNLFYGLKIPIPSAQVCIGRANNRFVAIILFQHEGQPTAAQAVSKNPFSALLRAWSEVRNIRIYRPKPERLSSYTKANRILSAEQLKKFKVKLTLRQNVIDQGSLEKFEVKINDHTVTYFLKEKTA